MRSLEASTLTLDRSEVHCTLSRSAMCQELITISYKLLAYPLVSIECLQEVNVRSIYAQRRDSFICLFHRSFFKFGLFVMTT